MENKTYYIKVQADGINYTQLIADIEDLEILKGVLYKVLRNAGKIVNINKSEDGK